MPLEIAEAESPSRLGIVRSMTIDLAGLWNFADPAASERSLREALCAATGDDAIILRTQIARTHGLRRNFDEALRILVELEPSVPGASAAARAHYALELGRARVSATHGADALTDDAREEARSHFERAASEARAAGLDALAVDAIHMLALAETEPAAQLRRTREALAVAVVSSQPAARRWEASLLNNLGCALHAEGRFEEALAEFTRASDLRAAQGDAAAHRIARWMIGWTLRSMGRLADALEVQNALEAECAAAGAPDPHVFAELAAIHEALGDAARALAYRSRSA
jgi:tetratricopeptide (TPR) repeat protein